MTKNQQLEQLEQITENVNSELSRLGFGVGGEIWVMRSACYECPELDNHCRIDCKRKGKHYLEKTRIIRVEVICSGALSNYKFVDAEGGRFHTSDIGVTIFTDKKEALEKL